MEPKSKCLYLARHGGDKQRIRKRPRPRFIYPPPPDPDPWGYPLDRETARRRMDRVFLEAGFPTADDLAAELDRALNDARAELNAAHRFHFGR